MNLRKNPSSSPKPVSAPKAVASGARPVSARSLAARVVERVAEDGAFLAAVLDAELSRQNGLDVRDRALATQLAYGTVRTQPALLDVLAKYAPRGLKQLDAQVRAHLVVAAYQLLLLDRVPGFAAVNEAVSAIRALRGPRVAGFANAVLRRIATSNQKLTEGEAILASTAPWLLAALSSCVGREDAEALLGIRPWTPTTTLRLRLGAEVPAWLQDKPQGRVSPLARHVHGLADVRRLSGFAEGRFVVQEEGAQAVALALDVQPGDKVLDACSGRGQKTSLFAEQQSHAGHLWATDLYLAKLEALQQEFARLGLAPPQTACVDWTVGPSLVPTGFDRVLVDAPCSGVGTLRRRPEILRRLQPQQPAELGKLAEAILRGAATRARSGGCVVFAVCSVLPEECEQVVHRVRDLLEPQPLAPALTAALELPPETSELRLLPRYGTDGYFIASFVRR